MLKYIVSFVLFFSVNAQESIDLGKFVVLYQWTQGDGFDAFCNETQAVCENQLIYRVDSIYFVGDKSFVKFFMELSADYKKKLSRLERGGGKISGRPEDFLLCVGFITKLSHLWNHLFKSCVVNQQKIVDRISLVQHEDTRRASLTGCEANLKTMSSYLEKWLPKLREFYQEEIYWLSSLKESGIIQGSAFANIDPEIMSDENYNEMGIVIDGIRKLSVQNLSEIRSQSSSNSSSEAGDSQPEEVLLEEKKKRSPIKKLMDRVAGK